MKTVDEIIVEINSNINRWINEAISKKGNSLKKSVVKPLTKSMDKPQSFFKKKIPKEEIFKMMQHSHNNTSSVCI